MDEQVACALLKRERYTEVYVWEDKSGKRYEPHFHRTDTKLIIQRGSMKVTIAGKTALYNVGDVLVTENSDD